jgi:hypothetical protein
MTGFLISLTIIGTIAGILKWNDQRKGKHK